MKNIVFFTDPAWSLGRLARDISKYLWQYDINAQILPWGKLYRPEQVKQFVNTVDWFVSSTNGNTVLHNYGVPLEKCIEIFYHTSDLQKFLQLPSELRRRVGRVATVSRSILKLVEQNNIDLNQILKYVHIGFSPHSFYNGPSQQLQTVGFASGWHTREETEQGRQKNAYEPWVFKRGYLVQEAAQSAGLNFSIAQRYSKTVLTMPGWYKSVDAVICSSEDQGAGGPVIEGALAGKLIITTRAGDFDLAIGPQGADTVPVNETEFLNESIKLLTFYKNNPSKYRERCAEIQSYAVKNYSWDNFIEPWAHLFS